MAEVRQQGYRQGNGYLSSAAMEERAVEEAMELYSRVRKKERQKKEALDAETDRVIVDDLKNNWKDDLIG